MATHSILLNNTLTYLTNFVSIANVELYHLPGAVNVLADVLSRAISNNLNNKMPTEHPISKQWAKVLPPIPDNFGVSHETLYKFLTKPLQPEPQDIHDKTLRKLMEPKSVFNMYKESQSMTPEQKFHSAQVLLKQWFSEYARKNAKPEPHTAAIYNSKLQLDLELHKKCIEKVHEIMEKIYSEIKGTPLFKTLQKNLEEVSKNYLTCLKTPLSSDSINRLKNSQTNLLSTTDLINKNNIESRAKQEVQINFIQTIKIQLI